MEYPVVMDYPLLPVTEASYQTRRAAYSAQIAQYPDSSSYPEAYQSKQYPQMQQDPTGYQASQNIQQTQSQHNVNQGASQILGNNSADIKNNTIQTKESRKSKKVGEGVEGKEKDAEKDIKDLKAEQSADEVDSQLDDEEATNEQTHPSSKHIEQESTAQDKEATKDKVGVKEKEAKKVEKYREMSSSSSGNEGSSNDFEQLKDNGNLLGENMLVEDRLGAIEDGESQFDSIKHFNKNVHFSSELTGSPDDDQNSEGSGFGEEIEEESGSTPQIASGDKKSKKEEDNNETKLKEADEKEDEKKFGDKATEQERTENAEKYEDEEKQAEKGTKPVQQRSHDKKKNLMEKMLENNELQVVAVTKGKARQKVSALKFFSKMVLDNKITRRSLMSYSRSY